MTGRTGRRPGTATTRAAILRAARDSFAIKGFGGTTIRQIASAAAVDPALVLHYFTTKDQLLLAVLRDVVDPRLLLTELLAGDAAESGERFVRRFLTLWEGDAGLTASALLRTAVVEEQAAQLVREVVIPAAVDALVQEVGVEPAEAPTRSTLIATQLSGLVLTRYVLKVEPIASASIEWLAAVVGPTLTRYLNGELPESRTAVDQPRNG